MDTPAGSRPLPSAQLTAVIAIAVAALAPVFAFQSAWYGDWYAKPFS